MNPEPETTSEVRLPLTEHLEELRKRLMWSLAAMGVGTVLCYSRAEWIYRTLLTPLTARLPRGPRPAVSPHLRVRPRLRGTHHRSDAGDEGVPLSDSADPFPLRGDVRDTAGPVSCGAGGNPLPEPPAPRGEGGGGRRLSPR